MTPSSACAGCPIVAETFRAQMIRTPRNERGEDHSTHATRRKRRNRCKQWQHRSGLRSMKVNPKMRAINNRKFSKDTTSQPARGAVT
jgi:hypothetical protein